MLEDKILQALKEACVRAGSQVELAKSTGLSQGQISDYLCGRRKIKNMTAGTIEKIFPLIEVKFFPDTPCNQTSQTDRELLIDLQKRVAELEKDRDLKEKNDVVFCRRLNGATSSASVK